MEVLVAYENGTRFVATCDGHQVVTGTGDDGDSSRDGMWPAQLFVASLGMCIGGYVASYCKHHDIPCDDLRVELDRDTAHAPSRTTRVTAKIYLGAELSQKRRGDSAGGRPMPHHQQHQAGHGGRVSLGQPRG
jgi:uncharacterized OsmC-like protein